MSGGNFISHIMPTSTAANIQQEHLDDLHYLLK
jgi:hypothetical protein